MTTPKLKMYTIQSSRSLGMTKTKMHNTAKDRAISSDLMVMTLEKISLIFFLLSTFTAISLVALRLKPKSTTILKKTLKEWANMIKPKRSVPKTLTM